jgi:hypothetical protein
MAQPRSIAAEERIASSEAALLERLLALYDRQAELYDEVLALSRQQAGALDGDRPLQEICQVLARKRDLLDEIAALESEGTADRERWRRGRRHWSGGSQARLHRALQEVAGRIESILLQEEENDRLLLALGGAH